jgi:hypothetical protein
VGAESRWSNLDPQAGLSKSHVVRSQRIEHIESELLLCEHELCCLQRRVGLGSKLEAADVAVVGGHEAADSILRQDVAVDWNTMKDFMNSIQSCVQKGIVSKLIGSKEFPDAFKNLYGDDEFNTLLDKLSKFTYSNALLSASMDIEFHNRARPGWDWAGDRWKVHLEKDGDGVKWEQFLSETLMGNVRNRWVSQQSGSIKSTADLEAFFGSWLGRIDNWKSFYEKLIKVYFG